MILLREIVEKIEELGKSRGASVIKLKGVTSASFPFISAYLHCSMPQRNLVIVTQSQKEQELFFYDFANWHRIFEGESLSEKEERRNRNEPLFFSAWDVFPDDGRLPGVDSLFDRLLTINELCKCNLDAGCYKESNHVNGRARHGNVVVASYISLIQKTLNPEYLQKYTLCVRTGIKVEPQKIAEHLVDCFYEPVAKVSQKGEFSLRGGILDVFPITELLPVRIEFFGDVVDSIRLFDPITQISQKKTNFVSILPAGEFAIIKNYYEKNNKDNISASLFDYLDEDTILILCEPDKISETLTTFCSNIKDDVQLYFSWDEVVRTISEKGIQVIELFEETLSEEYSSNNADGENNDFTQNRAGENNVSSDYGESHADFQKLTDSGSNLINCLSKVEKLNGADDNNIDVFIDSLETWRPLSDRGIDYQIQQLQTRDFFRQIQNWFENGFSIILICQHESQFKRFHELWKEFGLNIKIFASYSGNEKTESLFNFLSNEESRQNIGRFLFYHGVVSRGFIILKEKFVVISDAEVFGRIKSHHPRSLKIKSRSQYFQNIIDITDLEEGDYVVHINHGIGRFLGLSKIPTTAQMTGSGVSQMEECLVIEYAPSKKGQEPPKLYVPISEAHLITKYIGTGGGRPILNKLTGKKWLNTRQRAENAIKDFASELITIQAERMSSPGFAFLPDTPWQHDFENTFEFEETPDQLRAIIETKADMESPKPMDRLICGDAGYGKTEVALRAAFKAVMSGKQVAVLVPTTVLAQQHYLTFTSRMTAFPVNICMLSRFKTKAQQKEIMEKIAQGAIDIVIGTHRIIQNDVRFHALGLLIIDEEQRFGVVHKEKLKLMKRNVDVLTLSATPIPRTLYLALMGARDMSVIQTPPHDRLPIETIVARYDDNLVRNAILRELNRGGQVFYLHNQIYDIEDIGNKLKNLVPQARIVIGHGKMPPSRLEKIMAEFIAGKADILLSTTIVENGLDIPRANTIIIDRADKYGLSDLYQLRGRVGRYRNQAYAYLLIPRHAELLSNARKRISAIRQYSSPGSGFKVAMRDLEIRGAGNILGVEQSGHIAAIGFHLYCQLLNQTIKSLKGQKPGIIKNASVRFDFLITNPSVEIPDPITLEKPTSRKRKTLMVPREVAFYCDSYESSNANNYENPIEYAPAYIPIDYIQDYSQRTEVYRKIAQTSSTEELKQIENEIRDRFGPLPQSVSFFLKLEEIKIICSEKGISSIETEGSKLKIIRNGDYMMFNGKFPRLIKIKPEAKLKEILHLLRML